MKTLHIIDIFLLCTTFIACLTVWHKKPYVKVMVVLLGLTIIKELIVVISNALTLREIEHVSTDYYAGYHVYIILKYALMMLLISYFIENKKIRLITLWSILPFGIISLLISFSTSFYSYPGYSINLMGISIILLNFIVLFNLPPQTGKSIFLNPVFWFCISCIFYYIGVFTNNLIHQIMIANNKQIVVSFLWDVLYRTCNSVFYIFIIIGVICLKRT